MTFNRLLGAATTVAALALATAPTLAQTKFEFWYGLSGDLSDRIQDMCKDFNASQADYEIVCVSQDNYEANLQNTIAAFRANKQPTIAQISDGGTVDLMLSGAYLPVRQLMEENGYDINWEDYFSGVASYFATSTGELLAMPFNNSTAMFYYNTDALKAVGFEGAPETWEQVEKIARDLKAAGYDCPVAFDPTGQWQWWEQFSAIHNQPIASNGNGYGGLDAEVLFNQGKFVDQLGWFKKMYDEGLFVVKSKATGDTANDAFVNARCQMSSSSVADHGFIGKQAVEGMHWDVAMLPVWEGTERQNSLVGGAALWTLKGKSAEEYKGAAAFYAFIAKPEQAEWWSTVTGYIPVTNSGYDAMVAKGFYSEAPYKGRELALKSLTFTPPSEYTRGVRLGNFGAVRKEIQDAMSAVLFNNVPVQQALDDAATRSNEVLRKFEATYAGKTLP
ncbi:glycerol 3-phosphate ABC transporter [Devosia epidermidihirudinis]|uniref:sn-glycerol-3-phosphate-binding periplasmic protein UgpB n=1 Tax=Devosia epidermidihirudinis TaxID=1293439 RepID=A0A0F5Q353_9HYPH|nr:extracellular solute-binding protein [Devosia epidermidihirudinis]KKC35310.1 glycerol 3-phosphate ABC transporter [Devosia epidermidihirudinis]